jgi:hypothetical protein
MQWTRRLRIVERYYNRKTRPQPARRFDMDIATTAVQKLQPAADSRREQAAWPIGKPSVVNLVDLIADRFRVRLDQPSGVSTR